jgi:hypothetical protein
MRSSKPVTSAPTAPARRTARALVRGREAGFALPSAIIVLFVITMLTSAAIVVATQSSTSTTRDNNVKAEIEAAEAGLHVASYRMSQLEPTKAQCINESEAVEPGNSPCHDSSESLGNGATFQYWTTVPLKAGEACAGRKAVAEPGVFQRCVTSEGTVNGVQPAVRLQVRVAAPPLFPINGLIGLESVEIANNAKVQAPGGTNGKFRINNNASMESVTLGQSAPVTQPEVGKGGSSGPVTREPTNLTLAPVNPGTSATENSDYRIENGLKSPKVAPYDESSNVAYSGVTRTLAVGAGGSLTLNGEIYNFCNFTAGIGATITLGAKVKPTKIFIDSPNDPSGKCKAGDGKLSIANNANIVNPAKEASALQIYVYDGSGGPVELSNNVIFYGTIYAPNSTVEIHNNAEFFGAVAGRVIDLKNNGTFHSEKNVENLRAGPYRRAVWEQCERGSGATEGC